jgi:uncharacterized protein (TIGR02466 family)
MREARSEESGMGLHSFFPTRVYSAALQRSGWRELNGRLLHECLQMRVDDAAGRKWSAQNYAGGYTSYSSQHRMQSISPTFAKLAQRIDRHVAAYARALELDLEGRQLAMTDCWINIMPRHVVHGLHIHPLSTISGTYYVQTPRGCASIKFEDPRLDRFMAAPPRRTGCSPQAQPWVTVPAEAGKVVLFESWLRHEVPPNPVRQERVSISFNYGWF